MKPFYIALSASFLASNALALEITSIQQSETPDARGYYTVTINGTGFGPGPEVVLFDDFNSGKTGSAVDLAGPIIGKWGASTDYLGVPTIETFNGSQAMRIRDWGQTGMNRIAQLEALLPRRVNDVYFSYSVVVPPGRYFSGASTDNTFPDVSSWKFTWIADGTNAISSTTIYNLCVPTHVGSGSFQLGGNSGTLSYISIGNYWNWHDKNYFSYGALANDTNPTGAAGTWFWQHSGKSGSPYTRTSTDKPIMPAGVTTAFDRVKFPGWFGNGTYTNFEAYYDDVYVAVGNNALARVELSDSTALSSSVKNVALPVFSWSDTRIEARVHREHFGTDNPMYVKVHDRTNAVSVQELTGQASESPPQAPNNFTIEVR